MSLLKTPLLKPPTLNRSLRRLAPALLALALLVGPGRAMAQCDVPYTPNMASEDLGTMTVALRNLDEAAFNSAGARMDGGLACLTEPLPLAAVASAYRFLGAWRYLTGDIDIGLRWFRSALELDPAFTWDVNDLPQGHPLRDAFDAERAISGQPAVALSGMVLDPPAGTKILLDGREMTSAEATMGRPHLLQVVDLNTNMVKQGYLFDGNDLPMDLLISESEAQARAEALADATGGKKKKKKKDKGDDGSSASSSDDLYAVQTVSRIRPRAKTPLMIAGAAGIVASGVVYGLSFPAKGKFDEATTTDDLLAAQTATNTLVIASGATLAVGVGLGVVGIQLDGSPGLVIGRRF